MRGGSEEALKEFQAAIALEPGDSWSYADLAYTLIWAGRPTEAAVQIEEAIRLDPHFPPVFLFYRGLAQFARNHLSDAAKTFEEAFRLNQDDPRSALFLAATYGKLGRKAGADAVIASFNAARVKQGGVPFTMLELRAPSLQIRYKFPEKNQLLSGLGSIGIPYNFDAKEFQGLRLKGSEIDSLFFGHRLHGRSFETGLEHGAAISADGTAVFFGDWPNGNGSARIAGDQLCIVLSSTTACAEVLRNPGGTRTLENEFILFTGGWGYPFSPTD